MIWKGLKVVCIGKKRKVYNIRRCEEKMIIHRKRPNGKRTVPLNTTQHGTYVFDPKMMRYKKRKVGELRGGWGRWHKAERERERERERCGCLWVL